MLKQHHVVFYTKMISKKNVLWFIDLQQGELHPDAACLADLQWNYTTLVVLLEHVRPVCTSCIVLCRTSQVHCVDGRGAVLPFTSQWAVKMILKLSFERSKTTKCPFEWVHTATPKCLFHHYCGPEASSSLNSSASHWNSLIFSRGCPKDRLNNCSRALSVEGDGVTNL